MNRERSTRIGLAALIAACSSMPTLAKDPPRPSLSIDPVVARNLLAPLDEAAGPAVGYRLGNGIEPARGQRARLSLEIGDSTLFAVTGRLERKSMSPGPLDAGHAKALGLRSREGGKVYGAGINQNVGGVDLSATYQYSKLRAEQGLDDGRSLDDGPGKSHSVRAMARIRFGP